jgi:hypothetical protein
MIGGPLDGQTFQGARVSMYLDETGKLLASHLGDRTFARRPGRKTGPPCYIRRTRLNGDHRYVHSSIALVDELA